MNGPAHEELMAAAKNLVDTAQLAFGFESAAGERYLRMATTPDSQAHLMGAIAGSIKDPHFFATPRSTLEVGCGAGSFLYSLLTRGHAARGIDNDPARIAIAWAKIAAFEYNESWKDCAILGDAGSMPYEDGSFDLVLGHQFIEHVEDPAAVISELLRVTRSGGYVVLYAPDYRGPFEAHYEIPWPPFATKALARRWLAVMGRPAGGLGTFSYVTLPQIYAIFEVLDCEIIGATLDRQIDARAILAFDSSSDAALERSAAAIRSGLAAGTMPAHFTGPTSFSVAVRKR